MSPSQFVRPVPPPAVQLTPRDIQAVADVARYGYLTATHLGRLAFRSASERVAQRRLRLLWANGYLDRHFLQWLITGVRDGRTAGRRPLYTLARLGRRLLHERGHPESGAGGRVPHATRLGHDLVVTDFLVALEGAASESLVRTLREPELWVAIHRARSSVGRRGERMLVSDGSFELEHNGTRQAFHVEVVHAGVRGGNRTIAQRMTYYAALNRGGYFERVLQQPKPRAIIFLTTSAARARRLQALAAGLPYARRLFWFGHFEQRFRAGIPETDLMHAPVLRRPFVDGNGDTHTLQGTLGATAPGAD